MTAEHIMDLVIAILFAIVMFQAALGLLPRARPRVWPFRITGYKNVRLSRFSLIAVVCTNIGLVAFFASITFSSQTSGFIGLSILIVGFVLVVVSRSRDVRLFRQQRLVAMTS